MGRKRRKGFKLCLTGWYNCNFKSFEIVSGQNYQDRAHFVLPPSGRAVAGVSQHSAVSASCCRLALICSDPLSQEPTGIAKHCPITWHWICAAGSCCGPGLPAATAQAVLQFCMLIPLLVPSCSPSLYRHLHKVTSITGTGVLLRVLRPERFCFYSFFGGRGKVVVGRVIGRSVE